ncbi:hypothetical protein ACWCQN_09755 [Streptomyces sp. NPDC001984]|uniref:hypothetical protein n=1 Tax=Streptomyces sp. NPDC002619 TaxID=3364655 RepID=UPI0036BB1234
MVLYVVLVGIPFLDWTTTLIQETWNGVVPATYLAAAAMVTDTWPAAQHSQFKDALGLIAGSVLFAMILAALATAVYLGPVIWTVATILGRPWSYVRETVLFRRCEPVALCAKAISSCVAVKSASWRRRPRALRHMARALRRVEPEILALHRTTGHLTVRSHRRRQLKQHAGLVVAALRGAEARVDRDGDVALAQLAAMVQTVAERIAVGRIGALLDEEDLDDSLRPVRDWEPFKLVVAALLIAGAAVGINFVHLPAGADTYVIGACGIFVLTLLYGRRVQQFLDLLSTLRGG